MMPTVIFDIETIPDLDSCRRLYPTLADLTDVGVHKAMVAKRQEEADSDFMRLPLHKIACLSMLWVGDSGMKLKSFSLQDMDESEILKTFFKIFQKNKLPHLVSWNGAGFDIPVILYRAMHHKLSAPNFLKEDGDMRYNNYLSRYHSKHLDLMDKMALYGYNRQPLDIVAGLCGFSGKQDIDGSMVVDLVKAENWQKLTTYCESDVLNTWLIYLRWKLLTGDLSHSDNNLIEKNTRDYISQLLNEDGSIRHQAFLDGWE